MVANGEFRVSSWCQEVEKIREEELAEKLKKHALCNSATPPFSDTGWSGSLEVCMQACPL